MLSIGLFLAPIWPKWHIWGPAKLFPKFILVIFTDHGWLVLPARDTLGNNSAHQPAIVSSEIDLSASLSSNGHSGKDFSAHRHILQSSFFLLIISITTHYLWKQSRGNKLTKKLGSLRIPLWEKRIISTSEAKSVTYGQDNSDMFPRTSLSDVHIKYCIIIMQPRWHEWRVT